MTPTDRAAAKAAQQRKASSSRSPMANALDQDRIGRRCMRRETEFEEMSRGAP